MRLAEHKHEEAMSRLAALESRGSSIVDASSPAFQRGEAVSGAPKGQVIRGMASKKALGF